MLESKVNQENHDGKDQRGDQHEKGRILQLLPGGPGDLFGQLRVGLFKIVNELSHLAFNGCRKIGSGNPAIC